jgi:PKD repeat protein
MNRLIYFSLFFLISHILIGQSIRYVNYGPAASITEGDNNFIQVINIKLPQDISDNVYLRLYDMSCGSSYDSPFGAWDSRFRFSLFKNEYAEETFYRQPDSRATLKPDLIYTFEIAQDNRYYNKWYTLANLKNFASETSQFTLVVEGVSGNDANNFDLFFSSDSLENFSVNKVEVYSFEPTLSLRKNNEKFSFKFLPSEEDNEITIHIFDFDGTKTTFSTAIQNESPIADNNPSGWSSVKFSLEAIERENYCTFDIAIENKPVNDITFYITDSKGKKLPIILPAYVKEIGPVPTAEYSSRYIDCNTHEIDYSSSYSKEGNEIRFHWFFDDGFKSTDSKVVRSYEEPGIYKGKVIIEEINNRITCATLEKFQTIINNKPKAVITAPIVAAENSNVTFSGDKSFDKDGTIIKYSWDLGDGNSASGKAVSYKYSKYGKYTVTLRVEDNFSDSCNYDIDTMNITINAQPIISVEPVIYGAPNQTIKFDASASIDPDGEIIDYEWSFGQLGLKNGSVIETSFEKAGVYSVKITLTDNSRAPNNQSAEIVKVIINDSPVAVAGLDKINRLGQITRFDAGNSRDSDGDIIDYEWDLGDGTLLNGKVVEHSYKSTGLYVVRLKIKDNSNMINNWAVDSLLVGINDYPFIESNNLISSNNSNINFNYKQEHLPTSIDSKYFWNFGDGSTGIGKTVSHTYKLPGKYFVIAKEENRIGNEVTTFQDNLSVVINNRPISDPGPDRVVAPNKKVAFTSANSIDPNGNIVKTVWHLNNVPISEEKIFEYEFANPGNYLVGLEVVDDFTPPLSDIKFISVAVNSAPVVIINHTPVAAPNQKITFDASKSYDEDGKILEYLWNFSDGSSLKGGVVQKAFTSPGIYNAQLTIKDNANVENSISTKTVQIKINSSPVIKTEGLIETCGSVVKFDASGTSDPDGDPLSFTWKFPGDQEIKGGSIISYNFNERGLIPVLLTVDDETGLTNSSNSTTIMVNLHDAPIANAGADTTVCAGDIVIFSGLQSKSFSDNLLEYEWLFSDSTKLFGSSVYKVFRKSGLYNVLLTVRDNSGLECGFSQDYKSIKVTETPTANAGDDFTACANRPVKFDGSQSKDVDGIVNSYEWDFGDGEVGGGEKPEHIYTKPGIYKVTLTITGDIVGNCDNTDKDELIVTIVDAPIARINSINVSAPNEDILFDGSESSVTSGIIKNYYWDFGDGHRSEGKKTKYKYASPGNYKVTLTAVADSSTECGFNSISKKIIINDRPIAVAEGNINAAVNQLVNFEGIKSIDRDGQITKYLWDLGDGKTKEGINISHRYSAPGKYQVVLKVVDDLSTNNNYSFDTLYITINKTPVALFEGQSYIYESESAVFDASKSYDDDGRLVSYDWFIDDEKVFSGNIFTKKFEKAGIYRIKLVITDNSNVENGSCEKTEYLRVINYPLITLPKSLVVCENEPFSITPTINYEAGSSPLNHRWVIDGKPVAEKTITFAGSISSNQFSNVIFELLNSANNVVSSATTTILRNSVPEITAIRDTTIVLGGANDELLFLAEVIDADGDNVLYWWDAGDGTTYSKPQAMHRYKNPGIYKVTLTVDDQKNTTCSTTVTSFTVNVVKK